MNNLRKTQLALMAALLLAPQWAWAHLVSTRFGEFYSGMLHPLIALNHLLPWLALGLLAGLQPLASSRRNLLAFPLAVALGTMLGCNLAESQQVTHLNLLAFFGLGLMVTLALRIHATVLLGLTLLFGVIEGYGNGTQDVAGGGFWLYVSGVSAIAYITVTLATAAACWISQHQQWGLIAVRALGSWIMAIGILYGGLILFKPLVNV